jgi:hypothetical protein
VELQLQQPDFPSVPGAPSQHQEVVELFDEERESDDILVGNLFQWIEVLKMPDQGVRVIDAQGDRSSTPGNQRARALPVSR